MEFRKGELLKKDWSHLKGRVDVESLLEDLGISIGFRRNDQIMCHCPDVMGNHKNGDANPSFGFKEQELIYNCFVCGGGDVVELVKMLTNHTEDEDAINYIEQFAFSEVSQDKLVDQVNALLHPSEDKIVMSEYPPDSLFQYRKIHPYLYERGLNKETIIEMNIGFDEEHMGITIPHFFMGKLVGLQRRHIFEDENGYVCPRCSLTDKKVPKYKNTANFPKNNTLYGYDQCKQHLKESGQDFIILVESPFTVLYLKSQGIHNVVASFGQFSVEQGMLLLAIPKLYYWPDNDAAGFNNTQRVIDVMCRYTSVYVIPAVEGEKSDACNLDKADINRHIGAAYNSSLFPAFSKEKLATLRDLANI